jgi:type IV secretory pathway VirB10-like protein
LSNPHDAYIHIRINRKVFVAVVASLLVHALLLLWLSRYDLLNQHPPAAEDQTLDVQLSPPRPVAAASPPPAEIRPPTPPRPAPRVKPAPPPRPVLPQEIAQPPAIPTPETVAKAPPVPPKPAVAEPEQFTDMASYVNAARERRRLAGEDPDVRNEEARKQPEEVRRNASGTSGVFSISRMDARSATFAFRGWRNELSYSHREVYEVQAGPDGDVQRALIRKMIEIIRRYYTGDFNWDSPRMGRVVVLSARPQDNAGLEDFLLQEFFGARGAYGR